jgi:voltage-gated potassium channel
VRRRPLFTGAPVTCHLKERPALDDVTKFVSGDPSTTADLQRVRIETASTAIILADNSYDHIDVEQMDSKTLLTALAVESLNPDCYTCVEVIRSENSDHFQRTRANEILISGRLTGALLAHSAITHGLSQVVGDLITHPEGNEFYWVDVPESLLGSTFEAAWLGLKRDHDCLAVGVASAAGEYTTNPPLARLLAGGERILVIADHMPSLGRGGLPGSF